MPLTPALIRRVIAVAQAQTAGVRASVWHKHKIGVDQFGTLYADYVELTDEQAPLIEKVGEPVMTISGIETVSKTKLTFFFPLEITEQDFFKIGDETDEWRVAKINALLDPDHQPYMVEVWLGNYGAGA